MMSRRLVNLAMADYNSCMYSLHRMDLSSLLFYTSTAEAEAARGGGRVGKGKVQNIQQLQLPPPIMGFQPYPENTEQFSVDRDSIRDPDECICSSGMFVLLNGPRGPSSEASRILFTSGEGLTTMYDVDSPCTVLSVPDLNVKGRHPIVTTGPGAWEENLHVMCSDWEFKVLDMTNLLWKPLPPLPVPSGNVASFAVVGSGRIICVSSSARSEDCATRKEDYGTFCFDTVSREWWRAGDWVLPFHGRVEHVPELGAWLGFSSDHPHHLCAADLTGVAVALPQPPTLKHVWEDFNLPPREESSWALNKDSPRNFFTTTVDWSVTRSFLVNLGSGRFCVAKVVHSEEVIHDSFDMYMEQKGIFTVLTGVEVIGDGGDGELQMVKHKSRQLVHPALGLACVL